MHPSSARRLAVMTLASTVLASLVVVGCGDDEHGDPVSHSERIGINLKVKADDVKTPALQADKNINTESGNPYNAFVQAARVHLGGVDPSRIDVTSASLLLGGASKGVTALEQALVGTVEILFVMNDTNNTFRVAEVKDPKGTGPIDMKLVFDPGMVTGVDQRKLVAGGFKVLLRSQAAAGFAGRKDVEADLQVTFTFVAYE